MADSGNGQTLLGGRGGQQRPCAAEQDPPQLSRVQPVQQISAQRDGAAAAAGAAGMHILGQIVEYQRAAIGDLAAKGQAVPAGKLQQRFLAQLPQVTGDDQIEILRASAQILKVGPDGGISRRG